MLCLAALFSSAYGEEAEITVKINGETLKTPIAAKIINDRTMLPMRSVFETLGANVEWAEADQLIFATKGNKLITLKIGYPKIVIQTTESNKSEVLELETAPFIEGDYTLVPVRAVAESLDAKVDWDGETNAVLITK